jgi:cytoplasmic tRNA 2-thiolation protein 2
LKLVSVGYAGELPRSNEPGRAAEKYSECFIKYISSKPVKRMESYRLKDDASEQPRRLLLPLSGGISSVVLLHILDRQLLRQASKRGRTSYELYILAVELPSQHIDGSLATVFPLLKQKYSSHSFSSIPVCEVFNLDNSLLGDFSELGAQEEEMSQTSLDSLLSRAKTASARADLLQILLTRLVVAFAKLNACDAILWGHSNSRLAAKALSAVAKGRGGFLPFDIAEGPSPWQVTFYYPLRDLFKSELIAYANALPDDFSKLVIQDSAPAPVSLRAISIDDLLSDYIHAQGEKYPGIIANVVRTAGKLQAPLIPPKQTTSCSICTMPRFEAKTTRAKGASDTHATNIMICYACERLKLEMRSRDVT